MIEVTVSKEDLISFVVNKLTKVGIPEEGARVVADVLVHANLRNVNSHGILRTEHYVTRIKAGGINPNPNITMEKTGPASAIVDGDDGLGHIVAQKAMSYAIDIAKANGIGLVGVINSSHCGAMSYFVNQAAEEKMIGLAMTHTDKFVVPFGGKAPFFGTNPIAFGFPAKDNKPIILDMATSNAALGKIIHAKEVGKEIPNDWGVDENGNRTTDPHKVSALLPFGGPKGYGLAMVVDVLSGLLTGSAFGPHISAMYGDLDKKRKLGHFIGAINPAMFTNPEEFLKNMDQMIDEIHEAEPAAGFNKVMVPGEPEQLSEERRLKDGIPVPKSIYDYLVSDSEEVVRK
ncbi:ureidoglycolate dehydrogenase [Bacillus salipaludis]|uniref:ureidoglycolate dehydrogenase n=1 Tax=Bacillus salipaludis TaxID=2547811 RepID=UPI002E1F95D7|nr:ureidoglycolate dehydrogenase [Bacillus salipaludis]